MKKLFLLCVFFINYLNPAEEIVPRNFSWNEPTTQPTPATQPVDLDPTFCLALHMEELENEILKLQNKITVLEMKVEVLEIIILKYRQNPFEKENGNFQVIFHN